MTTRLLGFVLMKKVERGKGAVAEAHQKLAALPRSDKPKRRFRRRFRLPGFGPKCVGYDLPRLGRPSF
jgi:hypothetical protein